MLARITYPPKLRSQLNVNRRSQLTSQAPSQYSESYSGMKSRRYPKEVNMLLKMLKHYNETKSISEAADICNYLLDLYQLELGAVDE